MARALHCRDKLIEAGPALVSELSLDAVLQRIIELAVKITGARVYGIGFACPRAGAVNE